jgi:hypothetical protein
MGADQIFAPPSASLRRVLTSRGACGIGLDRRAEYPSRQRIDEHAAVAEAEFSTVGVCRKRLVAEIISYSRSGAHSAYQRSARSSPRPRRELHGVVRGRARGPDDNLPLLALWLPRLVALR